MRVMLKILHPVAGALALLAIATKARAAEFDTVFFTVQALELAVGRRISRCSASTCATASRRKAGSAAGQREP
jgi:hypothetical protein